MKHALVKASRCRPTETPPPDGGPGEKSLSTFHTHALGFNVDTARQTAHLYISEVGRSNHFGDEVRPSLRTAIRR